MSGALVRVHKSRLTCAVSWDNPQLVNGDVPSYVPPSDAKEHDLWETIEFVVRKTYDTSWSSCLTI